MAPKPGFGKRYHVRVRERIRDFLDRGPWAVVGASPSRAKYGNRVLLAYVASGREVYAVNPKHRSVEGVACFPTLRDLPVPVRGVSVITQPGITETIVEDLPASGAELVWMQPGAESARAVRRAEELGRIVIAGGPCVLVALAQEKSS